MKIKWIKRAAGLYEDSSGRFAIIKDGAWFDKAPEWCITDNATSVASASSLRRAKQWVDNLIDQEARKNSA